MLDPESGAAGEAAYRQARAEWQRRIGDVLGAELGAGSFVRVEARVALCSPTVEREAHQDALILAALSSALLEGFWATGREAIQLGPVTRLQGQQRTTISVRCWHSTPPEFDLGQLGELELEQLRRLAAKAGVPCDLTDFLRAASS